MSFWDTLSGNVSDETVAKAPKVDGIDPKTYTIAGGQQFQDAASGNLTSLQSMSQPQFGQELSQSQDLLNYFGGVAQGTQRTGADALLDRASAQNAAQNQSAVLAGQGQTGAALGLRNLSNANQQNTGNIAGLAAQQKLTQQFAGAQQAQGLIQQRILAQQAVFENSMNNIRAQQDVSRGMFDASSRQTSFNIEGQRDRQALQQFNRQEFLNREQNRAQGRSRLIMAGLSGGAQALGAVVPGANVAGTVAKAATAKDKA